MSRRIELVGIRGSVAEAVAAALDGERAADQVLVDLRGLDEPGHAEAPTTGHGAGSKIIVASSTLVYGAGPRRPSIFGEGDAGGDGRSAPGTTVLRFAPILGGGSPLSHLFAGPAVPTAAGHDPRLQVTHIDEVVAALRHAAVAAPGGVFNVAGPGVCYLSRALRVLGRRPAALPGPLFRAALAERGLTGAWTDVLRYGLVADTTRCEVVLGFRACLGVDVALVGSGAAA